MKQNYKLPREDKILPLPKYVMNKLKNITIALDILHINEVPFLVSKLIHI